MTKKIGVLIMAYGGPESLDEIPGYLADIRTGRPTTPAVLEEITNNYRQIGGKSPLLQFTKQQVDAVAAHFDPEQFRFYIGMRHWSPWIEDTIRDMLDDGITHAVSMVLAPHYSSLSVAKYQKKIKEGMRAMIVPGSGLVRAQAEEEGLADIFKEAGFEWRLAGCSMCLAMNPDQLAPGERCAATSNRNFEGRQGRGGRTHLMSPEMAAAAAITGRLTDVRDLM